MAESDDDAGNEDKIGRGRPPKTTRFKPGECGNPRGRPKGAKNISTVVRKELDSRIHVTEEGKPRKITKREAVAKQLVNKAAAGDPKATAALLADERARDARLAIAGGADVGDDALQRPEDLLTMDGIMARIRAVIAEEATANATAAGRVESLGDPEQGAAAE